MKYKLSNRKHWKAWIKNDIARLYYKLRWGWTMGLDSTLIPSTGKGKYVSVYLKGKVIQIIDEEGRYDEIRLVPYQYNHGIMVERWKNGKLFSRNHMDIEQFNNDIIFASNVEQLAGRK